MRRFFLRIFTSRLPEQLPAKKNGILRGEHNSILDFLREMAEKNTLFGYYDVLSKLCNGFEFLVKVCLLPGHIYTPFTTYMCAHFPKKMMAEK